ncbi:Ig-like domain-containing protein [Acidobacteria bacterium AH-259-L09]|nr:Ig-like domain-containing protein [Acidobacteria bacterium AH-259-L09]
MRNSFVYAKNAKNIIEHGFIAETNLRGKPIAFSLLSVPLIALLGTNIGLKVASFLGTAFFLGVAYFFLVRLNRRAGLDPRFLPLELVLLFFNPLLFYQFWSAYPDTLFAGLVLLAFVLVDVIVIEHERDTRTLILLLGLVICAAILTKLYGMILGIAIPAYLLLHLRSFLESSTHVRSKIALLVLVFFVLGVAVVLAGLGRNPTLDFALGTRGGGYSGYMAALTNPFGERLVASIVTFILALVLNFHFSLLFLLKSSSRRGWPLAPTCFAGIYVLGLLPYGGTYHNMRFFLPVFPFLVVAMVSGMLSTKRGLRWGILVAYVGAACFLTLNYNLEPVYKRLVSFNENVRHRRLDNLRMGAHLRASKGIAEINRVVEPGGVLYFASRYYGTATHGVMEDLGVRNDIEVRYVFTPSEIPPTEKVAFLAVRRRGGPSELKDRFVVTSVGSGLFRLVPLQIELIRPVRDAFDPGEPIPVEARVSAFADARVLRVEFMMDGRSIAVDTEPPYEFNWDEAEKGRHVATARVHDSEGNVAESASRVFFVGLAALERSIARSEDDAQEGGAGSMRLTSDDLELIEDSGGDQVVGLRFTEIRIPRGAQIEQAYLQFAAEEVSTDPTDLLIQAELAGHAATFRDVTRNLTSRRRTSASVHWSPEAWNVRDESSGRQRTPDLAALIQEVIDRPDWQEGNALVLLISGSDRGERDVWSYDGSRERAPRLYIELAEGNAQAREPPPVFREVGLGDVMAGGRSN